MMVKQQILNSTQKTTASEIDDLMAKGMLCSVSKALRNTSSFKGRVDIASTLLIN